MRKLLLGTTALAAAATLSANIAVADVSISGYYEWKYTSQSSDLTAQDGTSFGNDSEIAFKFSNKTDSGLTIGMVTELESDDADTAINEGSMSISGGFGKVVLGGNDGVGDNYGVASTDLPAEEIYATGVDTLAILNADISNMAGDASKVAYHLPAMGGLTAGISYRDSGAAGSADSTEIGAKYAMSAGGAAITLGYATKTTEDATQDKDDTNMGVKIVSGDISLIISQGQYEASDEDIESQGASISYKMPNGMTIGAFSFKSEDDLDVGEEYTASGGEVQYTIASGLTAVITVVDYDYKVTASNHENSPTADSGTMSQLTLKTSF